jgi:hypothetical protein
VFTLPVQSADLGIVVALFFQVMNASLHPINRATGGVNWGLVVHTSVMFSFATVSTALGFDLQAVSFIDNRGFSGFSGGELSGPVGYQLFVYSAAINVVPNLFFILNQLLADGLLVSSVFNSASQVFDVARSFSSIVVTLFIPKGNGSLPSPS